MSRKFSNEELQAFEDEAVEARAQVARLRSLAAGTSEEPDYPDSLMREKFSELEDRIEYLETLIARERGELH